MISRRRFLVHGSSALALAGSGYSCGGCQGAATPGSVLHGLVLGVAAPDIRALVLVSEKLELAMRRVRDHGSPGAQLAAQQTFRTALLAWERAHAFRSGPLVDSNAFLRAMFWPVRATSLAQAVEADGRVDAALVDSLGVDSKGLFALERLLWERPASAPSGWLNGPQAERAGELASVFAADVRLRAVAATDLLGDGRRFAQTFAAQGSESLTRVVSQIVENLEGIVVDRLSRALSLHENGRLKPGQLQADFCGMSTEIPLAWLRQMRDLYAAPNGGGLNALVQKAAPRLAPHILQSMDDALAAVRALKLPLEQAVVRDASLVRRALEKVKALELVCKTELASALAVTLSIVSGDGD